GRMIAAKIRYRMADAPCRIEPLSDHLWRASFVTPQWAPTPGQYAVFYDAETCLGGGVIAGKVESESRVRDDFRERKVGSETTFMSGAHEGQSIAESRL